MSGPRGRASSDSPSLRRLRERIDEVDRRIVALLNERAELTRLVGHEKAQLHRAIKDAEREREVLLRVSIANEGRMPQADLLAIFRRVIQAARALEETERERFRRGGGDSGESPGA